MPLCFFPCYPYWNLVQKPLQHVNGWQKVEPVVAALHHPFLPCHTAIFSAQETLPKIIIAGASQMNCQMMALPARFLVKTRWWLCGEDFCSKTNPLRLRKKTNSLAEVWWVRRAQFMCHIVPVCSSTFPPTLTGSQRTRSLTFTWSTHMVPLNWPEHLVIYYMSCHENQTWSSSSSPPSPPDIPLLSHNPIPAYRQPNTHHPPGEYEALPEHFSPELKSLVARMLAVDPQQRLTWGAEGRRRSVALSDFWVKMGWEFRNISGMNHCEP